MYFKSAIKDSRPQYGEAFVDWFDTEFKKDNLFVSKAIEELKSR